MIKIINEDKTPKTVFQDRIARIIDNGDGYYTIYHHKLGEYRFYIDNTGFLIFDDPKAPDKLPELICRLIARKKF